VPVLAAPPAAGADGPSPTSFRQRLKAVPVDSQLVAQAESVHNEWGGAAGRARSAKRESHGGWGMGHLGTAYAVRPRFVAAASTEASIPPEDLPEVAVIGRSNVGKSSLLNVLTGASGLARVSDKPGRTTQLCWFDIGRRGNPDCFHLVDMPGYGFALASESSVEQWAQLSAAYLKKRTTLKMVLVLIDSRIGLKQTDVQVRPRFVLVHVLLVDILCWCRLEGLAQAARLRPLLFSIHILLVDVRRWWWWTCGSGLSKRIYIYILHMYIHIYIYIYVCICSTCIYIYAYVVYIYIYI